MDSILKGIKAFIFDMDGVLLDTESLCKKCWRIAARDWGLEGVDRVYYQCVGQASQDTLRILQDYFGRQKEGFSALEWYNYAKSFFYEIENKGGLKKMKGAEECLKRLSSKGYVLALASSTRRATVVRQLSASGLIKYFRTITCGDSVAHSKPDPEIYVKACASIGIAADSCIAVEDSPNGVKSAYSAGMRVIMVPDQIQPADEIRRMCVRVAASLDEI